MHYPMVTLIRFYACWKIPDFAYKKMLENRSQKTLIRKG